MIRVFFNCSISRNELLTCRDFLMPVSESVEVDMCWDGDLVVKSANIACVVNMIRDWSHRNDKPLTCLQVD